MNNIRQIQELNRRELESGVSPDASWHADYRDTAYIYIGGLPFELSEGDIISIFSQFGEPTFVNLIRDKDTGKSKGFAFLKYEDQRSTDLAVDNLGGTTIMNQTLRVDHTRYKKKDEELDQETGSNRHGDKSGLIDDRVHQTNLIKDAESDPERSMLKEERELASLLRNHDDEDPMKAFLVQEKKEEVSAALAKLKDTKTSGAHNRQKRHHRRSHRSGDDRRAGDRRHAQRHRERS